MPSNKKSGLEQGDMDALDAVRRGDQGALHKLWVQADTKHFARMIVTVTIDGQKPAAFARYHGHAAMAHWIESVGRKPARRKRKLAVAPGSSDALPAKDAKLLIDGVVDDVSTQLK